MKTITLVLSTLWFCFASTFNLFAQEKSLKLNRDTLFVVTDSQVKILIIGDDFRDMVDYNRADSMIELFLKDYQNALSQEAISDHSKTVHYIVHPSGKRRFKAESEDFQEPVINIKKEVNNMGLELPAYVYILYDIQFNTEIQIYVKNPDQLTNLTNTRFTPLLKDQKSDKKMLKNAYCIELKSENKEWKKSSRRILGRETLELNPLFGAGIIGSQLSPQASFQFAFGETNKYGEGLWRAGISYQVNLLSNYSNNDFSNLQIIQSINANFMMNYSELLSSPHRWFGAELGYVHSATGILNQSVKFGLLYSYRYFQLGFHCYFLNKSVAPGNSNATTLYGVSFVF